MILPSPSNPTAQVFDHGEIDTVIDAARNHDAWMSPDGSSTKRGSSRPRASDSVTAERYLRISFASNMETLATTFDRIETFAGDVVEAESDAQ